NASRSPTQRTRVFSNIGRLQLGQGTGSDIRYSVAVVAGPRTSSKTDPNERDIDGEQPWQAAICPSAFRTDVSPTATTSIPRTTVFCFITVTPSLAPFMHTPCQPGRVFRAMSNLNRMNELVFPFLIDFADLHPELAHLGSKRYQKSMI